ncbi:uncharacterized protein PV09_06513 [Verruconis gallopava]|uniref:CST complex subunit Stn1 N-terminal domain-containing protein n=1 Tax=Verruconis gallopava TaxID=253628 RepID=A0A0D1YMP5_9PEZI|nr:uncharacterized protein PV09_06513 [Verruconis gallopava]KIW02007.1 hypothetical protein PV09_06513 [Verruconis gallopava]
MSKEPAPIYPAYAFKESPTWFTWVKLLAVDVHGLREEAGFQGQNVYFYQNHPIRFVCLTGLVVSIDDKLNRYTLLELDDGSGSLIVVKITRLDSASAASPSSSFSSNTNVANVDVVVAPGRYDVLVNRVPLSIGAAVKVKCTISEFRNVRQLELKRIWTLRSTAEEAAEWEECARFKREVLCRPWVVSKEKLRALLSAETEKRMRLEDRERREDRRQKRATARKMESAEKRREHEQRKEERRKREEDRMNKGAIV